MSGINPYLLPLKGSVASYKGKLSEKSLLILAMLSDGSSEETIMEADASICREDIANAAKEALLLNRAAQSRDDRSEKIRRYYPRAFEKWSPDEEKRVIELYNAGKTLREIAAIVERQPNSIKSRLERLGMFSFSP